GDPISPNITQIQIPQPGFTTGYAYHWDSSIKGKWTGISKIIWMTGPMGIPFDKEAKKDVTFP
ncbi:MAG: hypothetical protein L0215_21300, partial [Gemmataceae bacterium]|nr:hypothetical protein [Gemmataceae bacterium]